MVKDIIAVLIGGVIGTAMRVGADTVFSLVMPGNFTAIMTINAVGSFMLGALVAGLWSRTSAKSWVKAGIGTGLLGSFTTLSGIALAGLTTGNAFVTMYLIFMALFTSLFAAWFGIWLGGLTVRKVTR